MIFNRLDFTEVWFKLESNEYLGILDTDYVEDYYGVDGQLTLVNVLTNNEYIVPMEPSVEAVSGNILIGYHLLSSLINGEYVLKGRVRDILGNYTILTDYIVPNPSITLPYEITITNSSTYSQVILNGLTIMGGMNLQMYIREPNPLYIRMERITDEYVSMNGNKTLYPKLFSDKTFYVHMNIEEL